jgi:hypothetical protein
MGHFTFFLNQEGDGKNVEKELQHSYLEFNTQRMLKAKIFSENSVLQKREIMDMSSRQSMNVLKIISLLLFKM